MSDKLNLAIQATRAGDKKNAQYLLTQAIQEDPDDPQSWFLLSLLVDDRAKKETYLTKVVALDPDHEKAHNELAALTKTAVMHSQPEPVEVYQDVPAEEPTTVAISSGSADLVAQDAGATLPDWMADDLPPASESVTEIIETTTVAEAKEAFPDWLQTPVEDDWDQVETVEEKAASVDVATKDVQDDSKEVVSDKKEVAKKEKKPAAKTASEKNLNYLLIGLVIIAVIIFIVLAYLIFTMM